MNIQKRPETLARITTMEQANAFIEEQIQAIRAQVGADKVLHHNLPEGIGGVQHIEIHSQTGCNSLSIRNALLRAGIAQDILLAHPGGGTDAQQTFFLGEICGHRTVHATAHSDHSFHR